VLVPLAFWKGFNLKILISCGASSYGIRICFLERNSQTCSLLPNISGLYLYKPMPIARKQSHDYILDVLLALMQAISKLIHFLKKIVFIKDNK